MNIYFITALCTRRQNLSLLLFLAVIIATRHSKKQLGKIGCFLAAAQGAVKEVEKKSLLIS
ncbi:MAG: hypothetical protein KKB91_00320 [Proteobacteria bacterium]|nr:hypothetical protein [Desulfocapsa sp.]MBU3943172.1 hypothetical protein [Pseudomonadota bacterium]MCG2745057.1 hypothetical protein [Desulfobacteraceae bacterium]MBU3982709.1 hypothetical protein [Pseudomonadota bacterium]MBU4030331.1 hypothetical protein [Pseudomonadota bacterium]